MSRGHRGRDVWLHIQGTGSGPAGPKQNLRREVVGNKTGNVGRGALKAKARSVCLSR